MKIVQLIKKLNNTELGKGGTHDYYVLVPAELDISDIFPAPDVPVRFTDKHTFERVVARNTVSREKRIVGLGQYYRAKGLSAGDEIAFEKRAWPGHEEYYVSVKHNRDALVFQRYAHGFEILAPERLPVFRMAAEEALQKVEILSLRTEKKRRDSPEATEFYDIRIDGVSILDAYAAKGIGGIRIEGGKVRRSEFYGWKKYVFQEEEFG